MPVLVVGADSAFGRALCEALEATSGQVRAYVSTRDAAEPLRSVGVHVAIGGPLDVERLEAACAQVHTVIHLTGRRAERRLAEEDEAIEVTSIAAHAADVARVVVAVPPSGRLASTVQGAIQRHAHERAFEVVECVVPDDDHAAIAALIEADARR